MYYRALGSKSIFFKMGQDYIESPREYWGLLGESGGDLASISKVSGKYWGMVVIVLGKNRGTFGEVVKSFEGVLGKYIKI